jgi:rubrerythrin
MVMEMEKGPIPIEVLYEPHMTDEPAAKTTYARRREIRQARRRAHFEAEQARRAKSRRRVVLSCMVCGARMSIKVDRENPIAACPVCGREQDVSPFLEGLR